MPVRQEGVPAFASLPPKLDAALSSADATAALIYRSQSARLFCANLPKPVTRPVSGIRGMRPRSGSVT